MDGNICHSDINTFTKAIPNNVQNSLNTKDKIEILDNTTMPM